MIVAYHVHIPDACMNEVDSPSLDMSVGIWIISYRICSNISPGFYILPGSGLKMRLAFIWDIKYLSVPATRSSGKWHY